MFWTMEQERPLLHTLRRSLPLRRGCVAIAFLGALLLSAQQQGVQQPVKQTTGSSAVGPVDAAHMARKKEIADDSARLLKLATDLKAEVDKSDKDTLSIAVIRKAEEIEKLAHSVKDKMKFAPGVN
jgi:hypothetical protein